MKKTGVFLAIAALMLSSTLVFALEHNLGGTWYMGGPGNVGMPCKIIQEGKELTFINERGDHSAGRFNADGTVVATTWSNLQGTLVNGSDRINWNNKTWWTRYPNLDGAWYMGGPGNVDMPCKIIQKGKELTFINERGDRSAGHFNSDGTVVANAWHDLKGALAESTNRIKWENQTWWYRK